MPPTARTVIPRDVEQKLAERYAPIICHELSVAPDKQPFDCFCKIDFNDRKPWKIHDRRPEFLDRYEAGKLEPVVYYSLVQTVTHYFILYSVYHSFDQKSVGFHEHDFEHAQVVVGPGMSGPQIEFLSTNSHHGYFNYSRRKGRKRAVTLHPPFMGRKWDDGPVLTHENDHPLIHVQPGDGSLWGVISETIGHGIRGLASVGGKRKWDDEKQTYRFANKNEAGERIGILGFPAASDAPVEAYDPDELGKGAMRVNYKLERVADTIWKWFNEERSDSIGGLFKAARQWRPQTNKRTTLPGEEVSRHVYFRDWLGDRYDDVFFPTGFVGSFDTEQDLSVVDPDRNRRPAAGKWPFEWVNRVDGKWYKDVMRDPASAWAYADLEAYFDPAAAYRIMAEPPRGVSLDYTHHPLLQVDL